MLGNQAIWLAELFPHFPQVACFPALVVGCMFSRACRWWHDFPHLSLAECMFSRALYRLRDFPPCLWSHVVPALFCLEFRLVFAAAVIPSLIFFVLVLQKALGNRPKRPPFKVCGWFVIHARKKQMTLGAASSAPRFHACTSSFTFVYMPTADVPSST